MKTIAVPKADFTGVILAGGQASRMGGEDKGLIEMNRVPMVKYVLDAITPQVGRVIINANRNYERYAAYGWPVIKDEFEGYHGPLAGMASSMRRVKTPYMVTAPCDSPFVPVDMVYRLYSELMDKKADISVAHDGKRIQPVFVLLRTSLLDSLLDFLNNGERKIDKWFERHTLAVTDFSDKPDTFININDRDELAGIESRLKQQM